MTKTMLIDASHAEETRVVVLDNNRLDDFDIETADKKQIKGNIYLAKVIRVEPSLQAAFVEYGGNRHGFLAFAEIHPDYYQIPIADRQKLLAMDAEDARRRAEAEDAEDAQPAAPLATERQPAVLEITIEDAPPPGAEDGRSYSTPAEDRLDDATDRAGSDHVAGAASEIEAELSNSGDYAATVTELPPEPAPEQVGGGDDGAEDARERRRMRALRSYKIQEVIHRRQIILIQVVKEERGSKGAALTTYISLAGRFSVLMPNSPNGGGVSRKITSAADRRRLKEVMTALDIPDGMGLIVRTAGANRPKPEITRDCEYLLRLWDDIREKTLSSIAPALVYEEATLIKRTIRDVYTRDIDTLLVEGDEGFRTARDFMRMLMPAAVKKVVQWNDRQPLYANYQVEQMLDAMFQPTVQLRSGGYLVINQTEALVAIDVNSGRATRERNIEDTALRTNMEAAEEVARQLRLRDLAGLIVIDFIDMEARRNNAMVERKLKDALKNDRARIQVGSISHFGLMEMSRQRLRPSISETMLVACPHCAGVGHIRSTASTALAVLRAIEDEAARQAAEIAVHLAPEVALYIFNHKRAQLAATEARFDLVVRFVADGVVPAEFKVEKLRTQTAPRPAEYAPVQLTAPAMLDSMDDDIDDDADDNVAETASAPRDTAAAAEQKEVNDQTNGDQKNDEDGERGRRRRRRRRRGGRRDDAPLPGAEQPDLAELPVEFAARLGEPVAPRAEIAEPSPEPPAENAAPEAVAPEASAPETASPVEAASAPVEPPASQPEPEFAVGQPDDQAATAEKPRRRAPRTPVRRRRSGEAAAEAPAPQPEPVLPVFTDLADIFEAAEQAEARIVKPRRAPRVAKVAIAEPPAPEPSSEPATPPVPVIEPEPVPVPAQEPEQAAEPVKLPAIQPVVIGAAEAPPATPKRGWWKTGAGRG